MIFTFVVKKIIKEIEFSFKRKVTYDYYRYDGIGMLNQYPLMKKMYNILSIEILSSKVDDKPNPSQYTEQMV